MRITLFLLAALAASSNAAEMRTVGSSSFGDSLINARQIRVNLPVGSPSRPSVSRAGSAQPEMPINNNNIYLLAECGDKTILGFPLSQDQFNAFYDRYFAILTSAGLKVTGSKFDANGSVISYDSPDGLVLRRFVGSALSYDGTSDADISGVMGAMRAALANNGLPVAAAYFPIRTDVMRPTFALYYLTKGAARRQDEIRLRLLSTDGRKLDFDLLSAVNIVRKDKPTQMAYIGQEINILYGVGQTEAETSQKLRARENEVIKQGGKIIGSRVLPVKHPMPGYLEANFAYRLYIYR